MNNTMIMTTPIMKYANLVITLTKKVVIVIADANKGKGRK